MKIDGWIELRSGALLDPLKTRQSSLHLTILEHERLNTGRSGAVDYERRLIVPSLIILV